MVEKITLKITENSKRDLIALSNGDVITKTFKEFDKTTEIERFIINRPDVEIKSNVIKKKSVSKKKVSKKKKSVKKKKKIAKR